MRALIIGSTLFEELGIPEYKKLIEELLSKFSVRTSYPEASVERKALLLYSIGARIMASEGLHVIARQALDHDVVLYVSPCVRHAFKELRFSTPVTQMTVHEFVLPKVELDLKGKRALLACNRKDVRPEMEAILRSYGVEEIVEDCVFRQTKIANYNDYLRIREYIAKRYAGYVLTCPFQVPPFKEENVDYSELLSLVNEFLERRGSDH